jgi:phosphoribosylglycinamide formyltransferase-1
VVGVGSDKPDAKALQRAAGAGVATAVFPLARYEGREERDAAAGDWLESLQCELVVLAGYMQLLSDSFVRRFRNRVINVHPALLPAFPGLDAIGQAIAHGARVTGVTVHFVDEGVDTGPILLQRSFELTYTRPMHEVTEQIHAIEHELLPRAIELIAAGRVHLDADNPRLVRIDEE